MPGPPPPPQTFAASIVDKLRAIFGAGFVWVRGFSASHHGIDLAAAKGTPIRAAASGTVEYARNEAQDASAPWYTRGGGNVVTIKVGNLTTEYAHLDTIGVRSGQAIKAGDVIGTVGMTGGPNAYIRDIEAPTGPHLHFAILKDGSFTDPLPYIQAGAFGDLLGGFNNAVQLPEGTILTPEIVNDIIRKLDAIHFFQATDVIPGFQQLSENLARDKVRAILMSHVGQPWNKQLQDQLQTEIFGAATAAADTPFRGIVDFVASLGVIFDPGFWIRVLALLLGAFLALYGGMNVLRAAQ